MSRTADRFGRLVILLVLVAFLQPLKAASGAAPRPFHLPAGDASHTLKLFIEQSGEQLIYFPAQVRGVSTNRVEGALSPKAALEHLLAGTALILVEDSKSGTWLVRRKADAPPGPENSKGSPPNKKNASMYSPASRSTLATALAVIFSAGAAAAEIRSSDEIVVELTPFEVVESNKGYFAENTMSGTRLNSRIDDLGASISVVTKQQMSDFAMLDINDVFNYEAGTEGTGNFTDFSFNRNGTVINNVQLDPQSANRVRGLTAANTTLGNFETSGRVPIDPLSIDAVEISRGPNAAIFGIGNAGGSVNTVPASANLNRDKNQIVLRADSSDGYRTSIDINRVLVPRVLAIRGSLVRQKDGYEQKPSGIFTNRLNGMIRYRPFKNTMISGSYSYYDMKGRRPNFNTPFDLVTRWKEQGSPTFDVITNKVSLNGVPATLTSAEINKMFNASSSAYSYLYIDQSGIGYWTPTRSTLSTNPNAASGSQKILNATADISDERSQQTLFSRYAPLVDRSIFDWTSINLAAPNYTSDRIRTASVLIDQVFLNTQRQVLAVQLGWFHEGGKRYNRTLIGGDTRSGGVVGIAIDVNEKRFDGSPNPYFLRPFVQLNAPYDTQSVIDNNAYRGQLAYKLDLTNEPNFLRWLGLHQLSGYTEYKDYRGRTAYFTESIISDHTWNPHGAIKSSWGSIPGRTLAPTVVTAYPRFYLGDTNGANVDYAPQAFSAGSYQFNYGNPATGFVSETVEYGRAAGGGSGGTSNSWKVQKVRGAVLQSHLVEDRVVTTFGVRRDELNSRSGGRTIFDEDGVFFDETSFNSWANGPWNVKSGSTRTAGIVVRPLPWLSLFTNNSDSCLPNTPAQTLYFKPLGDPTGEGRDYGFGLSLFRGKLSIRVNRYKNSQLLSRTGNAATTAQRAWRVDFASATSYYGFTDDPFRLQTCATGWVKNAAARDGVSLSDEQVEAKVAAIMKVPVEYLRRLEYPIAATNDTIAKGHEIELQFNPDNAWTLKLNVTEQRAISANIAPEVTQWLKERLAVWESIIDPELGVPWYTHYYTSGGSAKAFVDGNVYGPLKTAQAQEGKSRPQIRRYRANLSTNYRLQGITTHSILRRVNIGGALRWEDKGAIGYYGVETPPAIVTELDTNRPIYDKAHLYCDAFVGYRAPLFSKNVIVTWQLNVRNIAESGRLQPVAANPDGTTSAYRIVAPRQFILSATIDL